MQATLLIITLASLVLGLAAGVIMYRADFCVMAMFRDLFLLKDFSMMRYLIVMFVLTMGLFELGRVAGLISIYPFPLLGTPSLATLIGGGLFGFGMVLAGGCVVGTLYKLGGGSILALTAFVGLLAGSTVYAEFHPAWAAFASATQFSDSITLPQAMNITPALFIVPLVVTGAYIIYKWLQTAKLTTTASAEGYLPPLNAAILLSVLGFISYLIIGMPFGITTSYAKLGSTVQSLFAAEHVESLVYFSALPLNYTPPFADVAISGGAGPALDAIAAIQYPLIVGIILGAFIYARKIGEFRLYYKLPVQQYLSAGIGGFLVGMAARMTPGCNIWHLWGGVPILANQSLLFLVGLFPGAWLGAIVFKTVVVKTK